MRQVWSRRCGAFSFSMFCCGVPRGSGANAYLRISFLHNRLWRAARTLGQCWATSSVRLDAGQRAPEPPRLSAAALRPAAAALRTAAKLRRAPRRHRRRQWARLWRVRWEREFRGAARATRELCSASPRGSVPRECVAPWDAVWSAKQQRMAVSVAFGKMRSCFFSLSIFFYAVGRAFFQLSALPTCTAWNARAFLIDFVLTQSFSSLAKSRFPTLKPFFFAGPRRHSSSKATLLLLNISSLILLPLLLRPTTRHRPRRRPRPLPSDSARPSGSAASLWAWTAAAAVALEVSVCFFFSVSFISTSPAHSRFSLSTFRKRTTEDPRRARR